jgi:hypothetical protein
MALQGTFVAHIIWNSRSHTRIVPVIKLGKYIRCELDCDRILRDPSIQHKHSVKENARDHPVRNPQFGVLNKTQSELQKIGYRRFCERLLDTSEEESEGGKEEEEKTDETNLHRPDRLKIKKQGLEVIKSVQIAKMMKQNISR